MLRLIFSIIIMIVSFHAHSASYTYKFKDTPLASALCLIGEQHPEINLVFIYNELENYSTSATINTDDPQEAIRLAVGLNPVTILNRNSTFFLEALQHGKYVYQGRTAGPDNQPVVAATVMLLTPNDSTAITYAITGDDGRFSIPCDRRDVIAKISSIGYKTLFLNCHDFNIGTVKMQELPINLKGLEVNPDYATLYSDRTTFIPTTRQKNASQTGLELLTRMAIPYLRTGGLNGVTTLTGAPVEIFIDFLPASGDDMKGMRMADVRKVEYYDFPSDPRFLGKPHVVNFIMVKYEYGGYLKGYTDHNILYNSGQLNGYGKLQYKKMTYDISLGGYHRDDTHAGTVSEDTFRIPDANGDLTTFHRYSGVEGSDIKNRLYWSTFRATYATEKMTVRNSIAGDFDHKPVNSQHGTVSYSPEIMPASSYVSDHSDQVNSISYFGQFTLHLPKDNTLTVSPNYSFSHTRQLTEYTENTSSPYLNLAKGDTHRASASVSFFHNFKNRSTLSALVDGEYIADRIIYEGTSDATDRTRSLRLTPSLAYSIYAGDFYGRASAGLQWQRFSYSDITDLSKAPWLNLSLQYSFRKKHSLRADFNYNSTLPAAYYRSNNIIQSNPLMSYTGNPSLKPEKRFSINGSYSFFPSNTFYCSAYTSTSILNNRAVFNYQPSGEGILRTISQNSGHYSNFSYGLYASVDLFNASLQLSGNIQHVITHNGYPYNWTKSAIDYSIEAYYYLKDFNFGATFISPQHSCPNQMTGTWESNRSIYYISAGWADSVWNLRVVFNGFATWNWKNSTATLYTPYYDQRQTVYGQGHAFIKLAATYTFGFGKKINRGDESNRMSGVKANILK